MLSFKNKDGKVGETHTGYVQNSTLTGYFDIATRGDIALGHSATALTYQEIPKFFWWASNKGWKARLRASDTVGRLHFVSVHQGERYYMRLLLLHKQGVTSFENLRTIDSIVYSTYREAANAMGLLVNNFQYNAALTEAAVFKSGFQLRLLFAIILVHSPPADPTSLLEKNLKKFWQ